MLYLYLSSNAVVIRYAELNLSLGFSLQTNIISDSLLSMCFCQLY